MKRFAGRLTWDGDARLHALPHPELCRGIVVLWRGTIANRNELIREARSREEEVLNPSDGELFADAYRWWETGLQNRVRGEYAVAIYEHRMRTLLLARDTSGIVPLFYSVAAGGLSFASHLEDVAEMAGNEEFDGECLADYVACGYDVGERTAYRACRRLDAGKFLVWRDGELAKRRASGLTSIRPS